MGVNIEHLTELVRVFAQSRDWEQFHSPRNLVLALMGEVGELAAEFQWVSDENLTEKLKHQDFVDTVGSEMADVLSYLLRLADVLNINLAQALQSKVSLNESRYPVDRARGSSEKYTSFE